MKKALNVFSVFVVLCFAASITNVNGQEVATGELVIRQAQEDTKAEVAIEAHLVEDLLKVRVTAVMKRTKPQIDNITFSGPGVSTLVPETINLLFAKLGEDNSYEFVKRGAFIRFEKKTKVKELHGTKFRKLAIFRIPLDKIEEDGDYQIKVKTSAAKQSQGSSGKATRFIFHLENLNEIVKNQ
ncbi:hypothetical protein ACFL0T_05855 [Candidatus Omnitrophota bacterium]